MITGIVNFNLEAVLRLHIEDSAGQTQAIDVKVDTGFSDFLSLPVGLVASLGLAMTSQENVQVADGSTVCINVHSAVVIWDNKARRVDVHAMGSNRLLGMRMLAAHDVSIRVQDGGTVSISVVP
jgi:clan AA aspartic protease